MKKSIAVTVLIALSLPVSAADEDAAKKLNGSYVVQSIIVAGKPEKANEERASEWIIKDGSIEAKEGGKKVYTYSFTVDPTRKPAHFDFSTAGEGKKGKMMGIYESRETDKGLELTVAFLFTPNSPRPRDFKGEGKDEMVFKLLRKK
jgi:uncharacterized protein (TIGR03067 family)